MFMPTLYTLIGLPASGKSTFSLAHPECVVVSSDKIREELFGNAEIQKNPRLVFQTAHKRIEKALTENKDVIFDATNLTIKDRKGIFNHKNCKHIAIYFNANVENCVERDSKRNRIVSADVIRDMAKRLTKPTIEEGFNEIIIKDVF